MPRRPPRRRVPRTDWPLRLAGAGFLLLGLAMFGLMVAVFLLAPDGTSTASGRNPFAATATACAQFGTAAVYEDGHCYPTNAAACIAAGGLWGYLGSATGDGCTAAASDGGQRCRSGTDCTSGHCLAILTPRLIQQLSTTHQPVAADGLCAGLTRVRGCNADVDAGLAQAVTCRT